MSIFGPAGAAPLSGLNQSDRIVARKEEVKKAAKAAPIKRAADEVDVSNAQTTDAVRNLKSNAEEETADDRQEQDHYQPQNKAKKPQRPHLDVQG